MNGSRVGAFGVFKCAGSLALAMAISYCAGEPLPDDARLITAFDLLRDAQSEKEDALYSVLPKGKRPLDGGSELTEDALILSPAFIDGWIAAYYTPEIWYGFGRVWYQPLYVAVSGFDAGGAPIVVAEQRPIFAVGPNHRFYSGLVKLHYFKVPAGFAPNSVKGAREVLDQFPEIVEGPSALAPLVPDTMSLHGALPGGRPAVPDAALHRRKKAWVDGEEMSFLDGGIGAFITSSSNPTVIAPTRLYVWHRRTASGALERAGLPNVGTPAPNTHFADGASELNPDANSTYGHLWKIFTAVLPRGAAAFGAGIAGGIPPPADASLGVERADLKKFLGRVAADPSCFNDGDDTLDDCLWLDSERTLKAHVRPEDIAETPLLVNCPLVMYRGRPLHYPAIVP